MDITATSYWDQFQRLELFFLQKLRLGLIPIPLVRMHASALANLSLMLLIRQYAFNSLQVRLEVALLQVGLSELGQPKTPNNQAKEAP
jgi:hypothetical protein